MFLRRVVAVLVGLCLVMGVASAEAQGCGRGLQPIGAIQGVGESSPCEGEEVSFVGIVTGVFEDQNARGFRFQTIFVQDVPGREDGDPTTSDAVPVFLGQEEPTVQLGDEVMVTGRMTEFFGLTEVDDNGLDIRVISRGNPLPEPIEINPPADNEAAAEYLEPYEGMRVSLGSMPALVVNPTFSACSFAVIRPDSGVNRIFRHSLAEPIGQIVPVLHTTDVNCGDFPNVQTGDLVAGIEGPLTYHFDVFKIVQQETAALEVTAAPLAAPPTAPELAAGQFSIATYNLENYFDLEDDTPNEGEVEPTAEEFIIKQAKLLYTISQTLRCPTLLAVTEVEKAPLLVELAEQSADECGFTYQVSHLESADRRGIDVALLSDPRRVTVQPNGVHLRQACSPFQTDVIDETVNCPGLQNPLFDRPPLEVQLMIDGLPYTILVNHFKSKADGEEETEPLRMGQARHIAALVEEMLAADPATRLIVMGDFNDYLHSPVLQTMAAGGRLVNVMEQVPEQERYTYIFGGASQALDGMLVSPSLVEAVAAVTILHVNADYPYIMAEDTSREGLPYRSSDHDIPWVALQTAGPEPAATETATAAPVVETPTVTAVPEEPTVTAAPPTPTITAEPTPAAEGGIECFGNAVILPGVIGLAAVWGMKWKRRHPHP